MEFAEGGDLFDKIEADVGVNEDIAHLCFLQLISGVSFMHSKGVAHRDLKPENILMSAEGQLEDRGFRHGYHVRIQGTEEDQRHHVRQPPPIAPEVLTCNHVDKRSGGASNTRPTWSTSGHAVSSCSSFSWATPLGTSPRPRPAGNITNT